MAEYIHFYVYSHSNQTSIALLHELSPLFTDSFLALCADDPEFQRRSRLCGAERVICPPAIITITLVTGERRVYMDDSLQDWIAKYRSYTAMNTQDETVAQQARIAQPTMMQQATRLAQEQAEYSEKASSRPRMKPTPRREKLDVKKIMAQQDQLRAAPTSQAGLADRPSGNIDFRSESKPSGKGAMQSSTSALNDTGHIFSDHAQHEDARTPH